MKQKIIKYYKLLRNFALRGLVNSPIKDKINLVFCFNETRKAITFLIEVLGSPGCFFNGFDFTTPISKTANSW